MQQPHATTAAPGSTSGVVGRAVPTGPWRSVVLTAACTRRVGDCRWSRSLVQAAHRRTFAEL